MKVTTPCTEQTIVQRMLIYKYPKPISETFIPVTLMDLEETTSIAKPHAYGGYKK